MAGLAALSSGDGLDTFRPAPSRLERHPCRGCHPHDHHSTCVLSGVLVSSGESKSRDSTPAAALSSRRSPNDPPAPCVGMQALLQALRAAALALLTPRPRSSSRSTLSPPVSTGTRLPVYLTDPSRRTCQPGPQALLVLEMLQDDGAALRFVEDHLKFLIGTLGGRPVSSILATSDSTRSAVPSVNRTSGQTRPSPLVDRPDVLAPSRMALKRIIPAFPCPSPSARSGGRSGHRQRGLSAGFHESAAARDVLRRSIAPARGRAGSHPDPRWSRRGPPNTGSPPASAAPRRGA